MGPVPQSAHERERIHLQGKDEAGLNLGCLCTDLSRAANVSSRRELSPWKAAVIEVDAPEPASFKVAYVRSCISANA